MIHIMLTRPQDQSQVLAQQLQLLKIKSLIFPTIEIVDASDITTLKNLTADLWQYQLIIFISPAAIHKMADYLKNIPDRIQKLVIGKDSATLIESYGWGKAIYPEATYNREALLAMPQLQNIQNQKVLLCQGEGGDVTIAETLRARGAIVYIANAYQRHLPSPSILPDLSTVNVIQCTSSQSMQNLIKLFGDVVLQKRLLVSSEKLSKLAETLGFTQPSLLAKNASDEAILHTLVQWSE
jgi:uroporphyrinogen-III synthase